MARMLDALRRLEATNRLVAPPAPLPVALETAECDLADTSLSPSSVAAVLESPAAEIRAVEHLADVDLDEPPFEPTFGPLVAWDRVDDAFNYASHAMDEALDAIDAPASHVAESPCDELLATQTIAAKTDSPDSPTLPEFPVGATTEANPIAGSTSLLDEFDPAEIVREHAADDEPAVTLVGLDDAPAVAVDVLSTVQFAEHWATIALDELGVDDAVAATAIPSSIDDFASPANDVESTASVAQVTSNGIKAQATIEAIAPPPPTEALSPVASAPTKVNDVAAEAAARPQPSPAELAAMLDLSDATLLAQYTQLGARMSHELTKTTKACATLVSMEHQPHVSDVTLRTGIVLARGGKHVLVIDAALADKQLTNALAMPMEFGLAEVLKGRVPWQHAVRATATPGLCVLPAGRLTPPRLADDDRRLKDVLKELTSQWDMVLLDGGSLADSSARYVAAAARNVYLVVRLGETDAAAAEVATRSLASPEIALRGCIVTNAQ